MAMFCPLFSHLLCSCVCSTHHLIFSRSTCVEVDMFQGLGLSLSSRLGQVRLHFCYNIFALVLLAFVTSTWWDNFRTLSCKRVPGPPWPTCKGCMGSELWLVCNEANHVTTKQATAVVHFGIVLDELHGAVRQLQFNVHNHTKARQTTPWTWNCRIQGMGVKIGNCCLTDAIINRSYQHVCTYTLN